MKLVKFWLPVFVWCGLIFILSHIPELKTPFNFWDLILRKLAHISEYFILAFFFIAPLKEHLIYNCLCCFFGLFFIFSLCLYAVSNEIYPQFALGRHGQLIDILVDAIGIILFFILLQNRYIINTIQKLKTIGRTYFLVKKQQKK
ncbi:MAG: VanZ family protein [Candidatus Omnitrophica bacterium]|nr:VanZ family protein [Candidatus Omnitrophota bacterium]